MPEDEPNHAPSPAAGGTGHPAIGNATPLAGILFGATATGKTTVAVGLSSRLPLEVVSADSRQVYRHLDVGTAKPTAAERAAAAHHLIDFLELDESYNAARFAADALRLFGEIRARGRIPLVVGGAGFYLKVLREGLFDAPFSNLELQQVRQEVATWSTAAMRRELAARDPQRLADIHENDRYRLSRALEICIASGKSVTELTALHQRAARRFIEFHLQIERAALHRNIATRTSRMLDSGWIEEVRALLDAGFDPQQPGFATLGYPHVLHFAAGRIDRKRLEELVIRDTRRYARHQEIWFRKRRDALALPAGDPKNPERLEATLRTAFE